MFAEADNEINKAPSAAAVAAVTEVSRRAHGGNTAMVVPVPTDYTGFFKYLIRERYLEFGGEGIRKYDLIRWNLLTTALAETKANLGKMGATVPLAMVAPSYMASPPVYSLTSELPIAMYYFNATEADDSKIWANSLYKPASATTPAGTTKVLWVGSSNFNPTYTNLFAFAFKANHSELFPIYINVINASGGVLTQDYGY